MRGIKEDAIARISWGILISMAVGLVAGTSYIVKLSYASEQHGKQLQDLSSLPTDIAVIKEDLKQIRRIVESASGR